MKTTNCAMMNLALFAFAAALFEPSSRSFAQVKDSVGHDTSINEIDLQMLTSTEEKDRPVAFMRLRSHINDPRVSSGIRQLLLIESAIKAAEMQQFEQSKGAVKGGQEKGSYLADLADAVAFVATPGDVRPLLVFIGNSQFAVDRVAMLGPVIIDTLLDAYANATISRVRMNAATIIKAMLQADGKANIPKDKMAKIRKRALDAARSEKHNVTRLVSVEILGEFGDDEIRSALSNIIAKDEYSIRMKGVRRYLIREAAEMALEKMK